MFIRALTTVAPLIQVRPERCTVTPEAVRGSVLCGALRAAYHRACSRSRVQPIARWPSVPPGGISLRGLDWRFGDWYRVE